MMHQHKPDQDAKERARQIHEKARILIFGGFTLCVVLSTVWLGHVPVGGLIFHFYLFAKLAEQVGTWAVRRAGVSQEGSISELIERDPRAALAPFLGEPPEFKIGNLFQQGVRVDREGIAAKDVGGKSKRVMWSDVESCTFATQLDAIGEYSHAGFVLQGREGLPVLITACARRDAEKLLPAIRFYLRGEGVGDTLPST